jgi:hypothetical protein
MFGWGKDNKKEKVFLGVLEGNPFTIAQGKHQGVYRLFKPTDVIRPSFGYDSAVISTDWNFLKLQSCERPLAGRADLSWTDYRWNACPDLTARDFLISCANNEVKLGIESDMPKHKQWAAYSGKVPNLDV